ncbi:MAG TPA: hypothetical protein ENI61_01690 [Ignavibacteria bacterium]|nr:hypothetical protein [Ignavibacteria bacterium]
MNFIKKIIKQNLLNRKEILKASFVPLNQINTERFKYVPIYWVYKYISNGLIILKQYSNKITQRFSLWGQEFDFKKIKSESSIWLMETFIEGFLINFVVWALVGFEFNIITIFAWGITVKQILSIYWRLKINGSNPTVFKKNE